MIAESSQVVDHLREIVGLGDTEDGSIAEVAITYPQPVHHQLLITTIQHPEILVEIDQQVDGFLCVK